MMKTLTPEQVLAHMAENVSNGLKPTEGIETRITDEERWTRLSSACRISGIVSEEFEFRLTPRTRNICGFDVPAPEVDEPEDGAEYWYIDSYKDQGVSETYWNSDNYDIGALRNGIWLNKEDAIANAKALRGENPYES